jgi:diguanylate cyclase (GGDEF)-like protein
VREAESRFSTWRLALLAGASLMAPAVLIMQWIAEHPLDVPGIAIGCVVLFLLVIARLDGVAHDLRSTLRQRRRLEAELERRALHDPLTGLANRTLFNDRVERALAWKDERVAVFFIDLDDFKAINDTFGHHAGDGLLRHVAEAIRVSVRPGDTVARLGGDEFAVLLERSPDADTAGRLADRLIGAIRSPMLIAGQDRSIGASIGITLGSGESSTSEQLMREADIAMYIAKARGKGDFCLFDAQAHATVVSRIGLRADLEVAARQIPDELDFVFLDAHHSRSGTTVNALRQIQQQANAAATALARVGQAPGTGATGTGASSRPSGATRRRRCSRRRRAACSRDARRRARTCRTRRRPAGWARPAGRPARSRPATTPGTSV